MEVSVLITTFNHEKYIVQCLESIVKQKTTFNYEIIVGVDLGSDNTLSLCQELSSRYSQIKVVVNDASNVLTINGSRIGRLNFLNVLKQAKGKYIARCDGDDFWTDPEKLQKQRDYLEHNPADAMCFHDFEIINADGSVSERSALVTRTRTHRAPADLVQGSIIHLSTLMFRNVFQTVPAQFYKARNGDTLLLAYLSNWGGAGYIEGIKPSQYRWHGGGTWSTQTKLQKQIDSVETFEHIAALINPSLKPLVYRKIASGYFTLFKQCLKMRKWLLALTYSWRAMKFYFKKA